MPVIEIKLEGFDELLAATGKLPKAISSQLPALFRSLGVALVDNVKSRIISRDGGTWAGASKWARAKTGQNFPTLLGAEKYVRMSVSGTTLKVFGQTGKSWTLTQHHEGFQNELSSADEERDSAGRIVLQIKDPVPLNLYAEYRKKRDGSVVPRASVFCFVPKRAGQTPARRIWPTEAEANEIAQPIGSRWLEKVKQEAGFK
jgi:hypothetical protein